MPSFPTEPIVLRGAATAWPAYQRWTWEFFAQLPALELDLVGPDGAACGRSALADYVAAILAGQQGERYAAGWRFGEVLPALLDDFTEPAEATPDALARIPVRVLSPLLWLFLGGDGTGTALHHDSLATHAWLAVLAGRKRIALHPPAAWDPAAFAAGRRAAHDVLREERGQGAWRFLAVERGDLALIPSQWWHAVVNDGPTLALTRNVATPEIVARVAAAARADGLTRLVPYLT